MQLHCVSRWTAYIYFFTSLRETWWKVLGNSKHICSLERCLEMLRTGDLIKFIAGIISHVPPHDLWEQRPWDGGQALFGITRRRVSGDKTKKMTNKRFLVDTKVRFCFLGSRLHQKPDLSIDLCVPRKALYDLHFHKNASLHTADGDLATS